MLFEAFLLPLSPTLRQKSIFIPKLDWIKLFLEKEPLITK